MPTYHKTKGEVADTIWEKMKESGVDQEVIVHVSEQTIDLVPPSSDPRAYDHLVDAIIECAWKAGFSDALRAVEVGALTGVLPHSGQGQN